MDDDPRPFTCPSSPNCVSSDADDAHRVEPFRFHGDPAEAWCALVDAVRKLPRTTITDDTGTYLHAECRSRFLGFVDDLELRLDAGRGAIAVRSASRTGYSDLGVNRRRVDALRRLLPPGGPVE